MENNAFKLTNQDEQLVFDILSTETDKFGYVINHIKTSDNRLLDMVENNGVKYFKPTGEDWNFGFRFGKETVVVNTLKQINHRIEKNASSTIRNLNNALIEKDPNAPTPHNRDAYKAYIIKKNQESANRTKVTLTKEERDAMPNFFIYRDPIDRFLSICNFSNNVLSVGRPLSQKFETKREIIDNFLFLASITETNVDHSKGEPHILSQTKHIAEDAKIDYMVKIEDLTDYITANLDESVKENIDLKGLHKNKSGVRNTELVLSKDDLTERDIDKIKTIYADDYALYEKYEDKLWKK